jgi:hypothetical protein
MTLRDGVGPYIGHHPLSPPSTTGDASAPGDAVTQHARNQLPSGVVCASRAPSVGPLPSTGGRAIGRRPAATLAVAIAAVVVSLTLASCGGGSPVTSTHQTSASVLPEVEKAVHEEVSGDEAQAVVDFLAVVKVDPTNQIAWYNLGVIADRNGQATQAVSDYRTALVGDPHYVPALYNLAVLEASAHSAQAVSLYRKVIRLQPKMASAHLNLGLALESLGQGTAGAAQIAVALKLDPSLASRLPPGSRTG